MRSNILVATRYLFLLPLSLPGNSCYCFQRVVDLLARLLEQSSVFWRDVVRLVYVAVFASCAAEFSPVGNLLQVLDSYLAIEPSVM